MRDRRLNVRLHKNVMAFSLVHVYVSGYNYFRNRLQSMLYFFTL